MRILRFLASRPRRIAECWADYWAYALHKPRHFVLERAHLGGQAWIRLLAGIGGCIVLHLTVPAWVATAVIVTAVPGAALDAAAFLAHLLWSTGHLWQTTICPCCGDHGDDGPGGDDQDDDEPDDPEDHGLTPEDLRILDLISDGVLTAGPTTEEMS